MSLEKLLDIRARLATLTQPAPAECPPQTQPQPSQTDRETRIQAELQAAVQALDAVIADYQRELWQKEVGMERELLRTTAQPLMPPSKPGPHEIKWGF